MSARHRPHPAPATARATSGALARQALKRWRLVPLYGWVVLALGAGWSAQAFSPLPASPATPGHEVVPVTAPPGSQVSLPAPPTPPAPSAQGSEPLLALAPLPTPANQPNLASQPAPAITAPEEPIRQAREAFGKRDKARLATLRTSLSATRHPLAMWVEYWDLNLRLNEARTEEVDAFLARWPGSYVEDRLRNDWLLELGRRRNWATFLREQPRFKMNDDREVACYAQVASLQGTHPSASAVEAAQALWLAQRDADDGCQTLGQMLMDSKLLPEALVWRKVNLAVEINRLRLARQTAQLLGEGVAKSVADVLEQPLRHLSRKANGFGTLQTELTAVALAKRANTDPEEAADLLERRWAHVIGPDLSAWVWAVIGRNGAQSLHAQSLDWVRNAWKPQSAKALPPWSDETLAWHTRAALRLGQGTERWQLVLRATDAMSPNERQDSAWQYWRARAQLGLASSDSQRTQARQQLAALAHPLHFYGQLAAEDVGTPLPLPGRPAALSASEREAAQRHPGLQRALYLIAAGLRPEGVREWNFHLLGLSERELLAAAQMACDREVWDRCINTSEKTRTEVDLAQRYPMPLRNEVTQRAREAGLEPAYVYGLIRQESRFVMDARSQVGASGLMQVMPATAKWTAKRIGLTDYRPDMIADRAINLRIGTAYLKLVLNDQDGLPALAAAAYNAGPGRPRKWRNGPTLEPAIWAENVPLNETRDYVKKVLANTTVYAALASGQPASLKARLGSAIGPRDPNAPLNSPQDLP